MSVAKSLEKFTVRNVPVRIRRLGSQQIEVITSDRKKELQNELLRAFNDADYIDQCLRVGNGNLRFGLLPASEMSFDRFIDQVKYLFADTVNQYEGETAADSASSRPPKRDKKHGRQPHPRTTPSTALAT